VDAARLVVTTADDLDAIGEHEAREEADAELTDQVVARPVVVRAPPVRRSPLEDASQPDAERAQETLGLGETEADAIVGDREGGGDGVEADVDAPVEAEVALTTTGDRIVGVLEELAHRGVDPAVERGAHDVDDPGDIDLEVELAFVHRCPGT
jgi:hypothetical protein